jgi:hypothetical protein
MEMSFFRGEEQGEQEHGVCGTVIDLLANAYLASHANSFQSPNDFSRWFQMVSTTSSLSFIFQLEPRMFSYYRFGTSFNYIVALQHSIHQICVRTTNASALTFNTLLTNPDSS